MTRIALLLALLAPALAFAEDAPVVEAPPTAEATGTTLLAPIAFVDAEAPQLEDGIKLIPAGSLLVLPGDPEPIRLSVPFKAYLLPERHYDNALIKAKQLVIAADALDRCTETSLAWQKRTSDALTTCSDQFDSDESLVTTLTGQVRTLETRALVAEDRLKTARRNQAVAWAITGGLVLGASTVIVVAVAP